MIIFIVRKHSASTDTVFHWNESKIAAKEFTIHSAHATRQKAISVVEKKNKRAIDYVYKIAKLEVK